MKKKTIIILISLVAVASASAIALCNKEESTTTCDSSKLAKKASKPNSTLKNNNPNTVINKMGNTNGNLINLGTAAEQGGWVYFSSKTPNAGIYKCMPDMKTAFQKLSSDDAYNLNVIGDWIYYIKKTTFELYKIRTNGKDRTKVIEDGCQYFVIKDNYIYYWTGNYSITPFTLFKTKIGEEKKEALAMIPSINNPFTIDDKNIYYISPAPTVDKNSYTLAKMAFDGYEKVQLTTTAAANPVSCEDWIYYTDNYLDLKYKQMADDYKCSLWRINKTNSAAEKLCESCLGYNIKDDYIYYMDLSKKLYKMKKDGTGKEEIKLTVEVPSYVASAPSIVLTKEYILIFHENQYGYMQVKYDGSEQKFVN